MKDIPGYEGLYAVTEEGKIWSYRSEKYLVPIYGFISGKRHYLFVNLSNKEKRKYPYRIHRLIATTFLPNPLKLPQVNHKNGIKIDNRVENLEWCSGSHNIRHAFSMGLSKANRGMSKLSDADIKEIRRRSAGGVSNRALGRLFGVHDSQISRIKHRKTWKHVG